MENLIEMGRGPLAAAGTEERIRDRLASWGFELEPARGVAGDMGLVEARAKPVDGIVVAKGQSVGTLGTFGRVYRETYEAVMGDDGRALKAADAWYLFADPPRDGLGDFSLLWEPEARAAKDPYLMDFDEIALKLSFKLFAPSPSPSPSLRCRCAVCRPDLWTCWAPPEGAWRPVGAWRGY